MRKQVVVTKKEIEVKENKIIVSDDGKIFSATGKEKSQFEDSCGYMYVVFYNEKHKRINLSVHRLVAKAFLDNPNGYKYINHKDLNTKNNNVLNLEYCTASYNNRYANKPKRTLETLISNGRTVKTSVYKEGVLIGKFDSTRSACRYTNDNSFKVSGGLKENGGTFLHKGYKYVALNEAYKGKAQKRYLYHKKNSSKPKKKYYCKKCGVEVYYKSTYCIKHAYLGRKPKYKTRKLEKDEIKEAIVRNKGNFTKASKEFLMTSTALRKWCKKYGLSSHARDWK